MYGSTMTTSKNYVVFKNYTITDQTQWYNDRSNETDLVDNYKRMEKIAVKSAQDCVKNLGGIRVFRGEAENIRDVFRKNFYEIYDLWKEGHNIFYCDLDVVFMHKVNIFDLPDDTFRMFNLTEPSATTDEHYGVDFPHYFNCGIRYYPKNMSQSVWDLGISMVENWNPDRWDAEQIIYNAMMFSQEHTNAEECYDPRIAYQCLMSPDDPNGQLYNRRFNQIDIRQAAIIHVHGSRGSHQRVQVMEKLQKGEYPALEESLFL
jgi:hypothetical protein